MTEADAATSQPAAVPPAPYARVFDMALVMAVVGAILLALYGVVEGRDAWPAGAVAVVNGHAITAAEFDSVMARVAAQLDHAPTPPERAEVLARLVDEELLIQRGLALDLPRGETRLRSLLVQEVMNQALAGLAQQPVAEAELAGFYAANAAYFHRPARLRARRYDFTDAQAAAAFDVALGAVAVPAVLQHQEAARDRMLPDALLPVAKLREYLGAELTARISALDAGAHALIVRDDGTASVLVLLEREVAAPAPLQTVHEQVEAEFRRRRDEQAVAEYLRRLREDARIVTRGE